jgi:hypothetical protein
MGKAVDNIKTGNFMAPGTTRDNNNSSNLRFPPAKDPIFGYKSPFDYLNPIHISLNRTLLYRIPH